MYQMRIEDDRSTNKDAAAARERNNHYRRLAMVAWNTLDDETKAHWESKSSSHLPLQPQMWDRITECFRADPSKSYRQMEGEINGWCSNTTIHRWVSFQDRCCRNIQRPLPLITREQMAKHGNFSKFIVHDFWGLAPGTKVLLIHYNEKWFDGFVERSDAPKIAEKVGLEKTHAFLSHKSHNNKFMCVGVTGYAFEGEMEDGGHGLKLGLYGAMLPRCKQGTCGNLKFSLKSLLEEEIFPLVESLVKDKYKGFVPVFQSDSADLHIDAEYIKYVKGYCKEKGWVWAPQAPQMPHANNLDLAVFPLMSSQRSVLARESSNSEAPVEEIWTAVQSVWNDLQNSTIDK